jgi:UDP-N-acetylmuramoyl-L-alanyl-D-glutamate--2,6-diaminopimelate ligase
VSAMAMPSGLRSSPFLVSGLTAQLLAQGLQTRPVMHKISDLLDPATIVEVTGRAEMPVRALCTDSRRATPGSLFFALPGRRQRGSDFVEEAVERGAVGVVCEEDVWVPRPAAVIRVKNVRDTLAEAARRFHGHPEEALELIGVAGTSGKTVVSHLLWQLLDEGAPAGLLGTINYHLGPRTLPSYRTTPEPVDLYSMLGQMRDYGSRRCILEVSSHGIDQARVANLRFGVAAFLNLSPQHLEYHGTMEAYFDTVKKLFDGRNGPPPAKLVVNADDPWTPRLCREIPAEIRVLSFGLEAKEADVRAEDIVCHSRGTRFTLVADGLRHEVASPLLGRFNVSNLLAAFALGRSLGLEWFAMIDRLGHTRDVRGRMERIEEGQDYSVVVDYMHTVEAYRGGLKTLRELTEGRLIVVFGCGGDRNPSVRPEITREVLAQADRIFATADNPRSEAIQTVFGDMQLAVKPGDPIEFFEDRRQAISEALEAARPGDLVLIAGKGHETYQEFTDTVMPFDDRAIARELLRKKQRFEDSEC